MAFTISGGKRAPLPKRKKKRPGVPINPDVDFGTALGAPAKRPTYRQPSEVAKLAPAGVEKKVRDLVLPAFLVGKAFPDPDTVASAMRVQTPETLSPAMLDEFWQTYYQTNDETGQQRQFFQMPESEHPINALSNIFGITGKAGFRKTTYGDEQAEPEQVTWEVAGKHLQFIRDFQLRRDPYNQALTNVDEGYNIVEWKRDVAAKLKSVGMEVKFNPDDPSFDPDFEVAAKQILLGSQLVYSVLGDATEQGITQEIFRNLLWTDFGEDELPKLLGVEQADWGVGSTMESVVEALKTNPAALQKVLYQGAMLGRPIGQSESRARYEYANKWGVDALPEEARQAYEEEAHGAVASLALAVKNAQEVYDAAVKLPWVGGALHVTGKVAGVSGKLVQYPFDSLMKTISSLDKTFFYDYQKGMTYDDWRAKVIANHGEDGLNFLRDLGVITDIGRFSETVDRYYAQGDTRYGSRVIEDVFLARTGEVTPLQKEIAQDADFFAMLGIAALVGDPLVVGAAKGVGRIAFKAGRKVAPKAAAEVPASEVLVNRWFQTVAERMSQIDDDVAIARIYLKNHTPETKKLAKDIAKEKDPAKIKDMLYGARDIGEFVDGGSAALGRAVRLNAYVNGKYEDSWIRNVYTPMHFGKVQTPRNPSNMLEDIIVLTKFGKKKLDKVDIDLQHSLVRRMYYADNMLEQQRIVDDFDAAVEKNIGPEGIAAYERFNHLYRRGRGLILKEQAQGVLYNAVLKNGEWVEGSRVIPTGTARRLVMERRQAKADLDAFVAEHPEISPQAYQDALKTATKRMEEHIWALRKSAAYDEKAAYTRAELDEFDRAHDVLLGYSKPQPFDTWQMRKHLVFKYDPRVLHAMTQGKLGKAWTLTNAWAIDPVMKTWKELVMGNLSFPVRVQLMDEMVRLVPEGIVTHPIQTAKALRYLKQTDIEGKPMRKKGAPIVKTEQPISFEEFRAAKLVQGKTERIKGRLEGMVAQSEMAGNRFQELVNKDLFEILDDLESSGYKPHPDIMSSLDKGELKIVLHNIDKLDRDDEVLDYLRGARQHINEPDIASGAIQSMLNRNPYKKVDDYSDLGNISSHLAKGETDKASQFLDKLIREKEKDVFEDLDNISPYVSVPSARPQTSFRDYLSAKKQELSILDKEYRDYLGEFRKKSTTSEPQVSLYEQDVKPITTVDTAITGDYSAEWGISIKGSDPQYFTHFARYLDSMRSSVVIKRLLQKSNGELPTDRAQIKAFIKEARDENSEVGLEIRRMLEETGRTGRTTLDTVNYNRWVDDYATKILTLSSSPILRRAMKQHVTARELKKANSQAQALKAYQKVDAEGKPTGPLITEEILPDELLFAVQRPDAGGVANLRVGNPLQAIPKFSPWHWIFNGMPWEVKVPLPGGRALDLQRASTVGAMSAMTRLTKDLTFSKKYWEVRNKILKQWERDGIEPDLQKLHTIAKGQAEQYMGAVTYTRSVTAGEDMLRNVIPFGSAYRQSMVYWAKALAKHPVSMPYVYGNYPVDDPFFHVNDHSFYGIPMPYWAQNDPDTEGTGAFLESIWPMWAWWCAKPVALAAERLGADPETIAKVPGFGGVDMPVFKVLGDVFYGMGMDWNAGGLADALLGSIESRDRMHANFVAATLHYGEGPAKGSPEEHRERPWVTEMWEWLPGDKPEVIHNFLLKEIMPMPGSVRYEEDEAYKIRNAKGEYGAAVRDGDEARKAELRAADPTLDALLTYEDLDAEGKAAWRADPTHASLLKWIVTPYRWDKYKKELGVIEAQNSIYANGATALSETEYERGIHNAIARQRGGTILDERGDVLDVYPGDQARRVAEENLAKDLKRARTFILKQVDKLAKNGFDREVLMYMYDNPELNWRFWQAHLRKLGLNPEDYNPKTISALFEQQYGESYQDIARKEIPEEKVLQARQFAKMIVGGDDLLESSPFYSIIAQSEKDQKDEVLKRLVYETGDQWFWMSPDKLELLGVKFTDDEAAKYVYVKSKLKKAYEGVAKLYGKSGYREARNAYWRLVDKTLPTIKGGDLLQRGLADRMRKIPYFTQPQVTSIGYSYHAAEQWKAWHTYETIREEEWEKGRYDSQRLKNAWKLVGDTQAKTPEDMTPPQRRLQEVGRVMLWDYVLMEAARMREELRSGYSEYYKDKGNSADSKEGEKRVKKLQGIINQASRYNKFFKRDLEKYFPKDMNLAYRLVNWYDF